MATKNERMGKNRKPFPEAASGMARRQFVKVCGSAAAAVAASPAVLVASTQKFKPYERVVLVDSNGDAIRAGKLVPGETFVFKYPFTETPSFLINLGKPAAAGNTLKTADGKPYTWTGGVGPDRSIVAFSAICSHKLSHPAKTISFINYQHQKVTFADRDYKSRSQAQVIFCCSERSIYDPTRGGEVLGGPAPQPLAAISLEHDEAVDSLTATGTYGGGKFDQFFEKFGPRLALERGSSDIRISATRKSEVISIENYSKMLRNCG